jgi:uncharacterized protein (DUF433 family)
MQLPEFLDIDDGGFIHAKGHRIGLHHILRLYNAGHSPEMIVANYPTLSLSLVHKTIAFYLDHATEVDAYIADHDRAMAEQVASSQPGPSLAQLRARLESKRKAEVQRSELI